MPPTTSMVSPLAGTSITATLLSNEEKRDTQSSNSDPAGLWCPSMAEESPAYDALRKAGLLTTRFRKHGVDDLDLIRPNTNSTKNLTKRFLSYACIHGLCTYDATHLEITVPASHVQRLRDDSGGYHLAAPGMHNIASLFWKREGKAVPIPVSGHVSHGDLTLVVVEQGQIGYASDMGHPVLLPPGLHQWRSHTLNFVQLFDLENHVIEIGPITLLTVDEGYSAVCQNNGVQTILPGGHVHLLGHRNYKFEKFMSQKIATDALERIEATSADNVALAVTSTVNWRVEDVKVAAINAAETMSPSGVTKDVKMDISKMRKDVLKQAVASLAAFIGAVNYSDRMHLAAAAQAHNSAIAVGVPADGTATSKTPSAPEESSAAVHRHMQENPVFDIQRMNSAVMEANKVTMAYGVRILSINILSATPLDANLTRALASGAVASAEALQAETAARGNAKAALIEAEASAEAELMTARADAESERVRAEGSKAAADLLSSNQVAVDLAKINAQGQVLGDKTKLLVASDPTLLGNVLLRPDKLGMA